MIKTKSYMASQIAEIVGGKLLGKDCMIKNISFNSKEKMPIECAFFALKGEKYNAEDFLDEAVKNGAELVISTKKEWQKISTICVENTKEALLKLASYNKGNTKIIGVTGSAGKTTVKQLIFSVLATQYKTCMTFENHNNEIGVAQTLLSITDEEFCVVEMGMRGIGEIDFLANISKPSISIITNIGNAHLERLGTQEAILKAKSEIIAHTREYILIPNEWRFKCLEYGATQPVYIGKGGHSYFENPRYFDNGILFDIFDKNDGYIKDVFIRSLYRHDLINSVFAYVVGRLCNISIEKTICGIFEFKNCKSRGEKIKIGKIDVIDDTYNASFESVKSAIESLAEISYALNKKPFALIGTMLEMGEKSSDFHKKIGKFSREKGILNLFVLGEYSKEIIEGFGGGISFRTKEEAIMYIAENLVEGDMLLVKASHAEHFEKIIEGLKEKLNEN